MPTLGSRLLASGVRQAPQSVIQRPSSQKRSLAAVAASASLYFWYAKELHPVRSTIS